MNDTEKSYIAGFADGDGCICIGKCRNDGFQLKVEFTQCNHYFLKKLDQLMDCNGKFYEDKRKDKYLNESAATLRICGKKSLPILELMRDFAIIKAEQAKLALSYLPLIKKPGKHTEREAIYIKMKQLNNDKSAYTKDYTRITDSYIAGLFDAEGNVHLSLIKKYGYYVKITQKSDPGLLLNIQKYLGYGNINEKENWRIRFHSRENILRFYDLVRSYIKIKSDVYQSLLDYFEVNPLIKKINVLQKSFKNINLSA